jgi:hypothetical protein
MTIDLSAGLALFAAYLPAPPAPTGNESSGLSDFAIFAIATGLLIAIVTLSFATRSFARRFVAGAPPAPSPRTVSPESRAVAAPPAKPVVADQSVPSMIETDPPAEPAVSMDQPESLAIATDPPTAQATDANPPAPSAVEPNAPSPAEIAPEPSAPAPPARQFAWTVAPEALPGEAIIGATATVRELIAFANNGQLAHGFSLYTDDFFRRFKADSGLSEEAFEDAYKETPPVAPDQRTEVASVTEVVELGPDRLTARISYTGGEAPPDEYFAFVRTADNRWLIDNISPAE